MQKRTIRPLRSSSALLLGACLFGCVERVPAADADVAAEPTPIVPPAPPPVASLPLAMEPAPGPEDSSPCPRDVALIADGESENRTSFLEGRGGYWYTYADDAGTKVTPEPGSEGGTFVMTAGGAQGTAHAARMSGSVGSARIVFAGMGFSLIDPAGPYDAGKYLGISFWAKTGTSDGTHEVRLKLPDRSTHPLGNVCKECYNDFGVQLELTDEWTQYTVPFAALKQLAGWGNPRPSALAKDAVYGIQFQVVDGARNFDVRADEIEFTGCAP